MGEEPRTLGVILPENNQVLLPELRDHLLRRRIKLLSRRVPVSTSTSEEVEKMAAHARDAIGKLIDERAEAILYACMWTSLVVDTNWDQELADFAHRAGGVRLDTASEALYRALDEHGARRLAVLTAYPRPVHEQMCAFLADRDYDVVADSTLDLNNFTSLTRVRPDDLLSLASSVVRPASVEAVCVLGTDLPTKDAVPRLQMWCNAQVITSNGALAAAAERLLGRPT